MSRITSRLSRSWIWVSTKYGRENLKGQKPSWSNWDRYWSSDLSLIRVFCPGFPGSMCENVSIHSGLSLPSNLLWVEYWARSFCPEIQATITVRHSYTCSQESLDRKYHHFCPVWHVWSSFFQSSKPKVPIFLILWLVVTWNITGRSFNARLEGFFFWSDWSGLINRFFKSFCDKFYFLALNRNEFGSKWLWPLIIMLGFIYFYFKIIK